MGAIEEQQRLHTQSRTDTHVYLEEQRAFRQRQIPEHKVNFSSFHPHSQTEWKSASYSGQVTAELTCECGSSGSPGPSLPGPHNTIDGDSDRCCLKRLSPHTQEVIHVSQSHVKIVYGAMQVSLLNNFKLTALRMPTHMTVFVFLTRTDLRRQKSHLPTVL